jgi:hypothetical protein
VHTQTWEPPGSYAVCGTLHFTTSFVDGAILIGHTRRDRGLRLYFHAGDRDYAAGKSEADRSTGHATLRLDGLWERDGHLPGTAPACTVELEHGRNAFDFELLVDGPRVDVRIDRKRVLAYCAHDGVAIEGAIGFAMSTGAVRVQTPTVQRRDGEPRRTLDTSRLSEGTLQELLMQPTRGIPACPDGAIVLWLQAAEAGVAASALRLQPISRNLGEWMDSTHEYPQPWILAVPGATTVEAREGLTAPLRLASNRTFQTLEHAGAAAFAGDTPWLLFVDDHGVLRAAAPATSLIKLSEVRRWSRMVRGR